MESEISELTKPSARPVRIGNNRAPSGVRASSMDRAGSTSGGGVRTLEKKNKQLNTATKQLEEKVKSLQQKSQNPNSNATRAGSSSNIKTTRALPKVVKVQNYTKIIRYFDLSLNFLDLS